MNKPFNDDPVEVLVKKVFVQERNGSGSAVKIYRR